ncbi:MAG: hypothetical protein ACKVOH_06285, partial [Chlamydiales bacterium]
MSRAKKWCIWGALVPLVVIILALAVLPSFLSSKFGKPLLFSIINKRIEGTVFAEEVSLSWFGSQAASLVTYRDKNREQVF